MLCARQGKDNYKKIWLNKVSAAEGTNVAYYSKGSSVIRTLTQVWMVNW